MDCLYWPPMYIAHFKFAASPDTGFISSSFINLYTNIILLVSGKSRGVSTGGARGAMAPLIIFRIFFFFFFFFFFSKNGDIFITYQGYHLILQFTPILLYFTAVLWESSEIFLILFIAFF